MVNSQSAAQILYNLINKSSRVVIMGHEMADYDSLGAAFGMAKAAFDLGKKAWVVIDAYNISTDRMLDLLPHDNLEGCLMTAEEAEKKVDSKTLLIVVDTHKPSMLPQPKFLERVKDIAVIDHHQLGEEYIKDTRLFFLRPEASSTSEIVTEIVQNIEGKVVLSKTEATALLSGIAVDTKNFLFQTGVKTFEAAAYLRACGAETGVVQKLLRDDLLTVSKKAKVISKAKIYYEHIAVGKSYEKSSQARLMAAKTADSLLNIDGVQASFVVWAYEGGTAISGRSIGEINVQAVMEEMGGGGHTNIAAAQVAGSVKNAEGILLRILEGRFGRRL